MGGAAKAGTPAQPARRPRLGFLGVGWIGRNRLQAIAESRVGEITVVADPCKELASQALELAPQARQVASTDEMLAQDIDGLVIATPSALHADQSIMALRRGLAVFCQKPLGRSGREATQVVDTATEQDRLLGVDLSYRFLAGAGMLRELCLNGELGDIYAIDLVFHNAYGPDKPWFYQRSLSGGGCLIDLGTHLVDLALWCLGFPEVIHVTGALFARGKPLNNLSSTVEDYAAAQLTLAGGTVAQLACSWKLPAGCDAVIAASFYGTKGGATIRNVGGSFYEFAAEQFNGTKRKVLAEGPEPWGGRAAVEWARRLASSSSFDPQIRNVVRVAETLDAIYESAAAQPAGMRRGRSTRPMR